MFNFKANGYDIIDQYYITTFRNLSNFKIEEMIAHEPYLIVKEYSNPRFNALLPKDYVFNTQYYIFNKAVNNYVQFNEEYFLNFKENNWSKERIFKTLKSPELSKYLSKKDKNRFFDMPGMVVSKLWYMVALCVLILGLLFNWVASPWNNEFIGDDKRIANTSELNIYDRTRFIVKFQDQLENEYARKEVGDWQKLKAPVDVSYVLCSVPETKISYILIINKSNSKEEVACTGEGVVEDITFPNFTAPLNDYLPDNVMQKLNLDGTKIVQYEEGIRKITAELEISDPTFVVHKNGKIVTKESMTTRQLFLIGLSLLPILFGLYQVNKQKKFKSWLNSLNYSTSLTKQPYISTI
jgi:sulfur carrier protein ThiS